MQCIKCHSPRIIKFLDGFGQSRVFCKSCQESILIQNIIIAQKRLFEFNDEYKRWEYGSFERSTGKFSI